MSEKMIEIVSRVPRHHTIGAGTKNGEIVLVPGTNAVKASDWEAVKDLKVIKFYMTEKDSAGKPLIEEGATTEDAGSLMDLRPAEAVKKITECLELPRLRKWLEADSRVPVKKAIEDQIAKLEAARTK